MQNTQKCLVLGAGATGKAMCAPLFQKMGCAVLFADSDAAACADIARRGGYIVETARGTGLAPREVRGVSAVLPDSEAAASFAREADYIATAVGAENLPEAARCIARWVAARPAGRRLSILLFENGQDAAKTVRARLADARGNLPEGVGVSLVSVEQVAKKLPRPEGCVDVVAEEFLPPAVTRREVADTPLARESEFLALVDDAARYDARRLYVHTLAQATLGYLGVRRGYRTSHEAAADPGILDALLALWDAVGEMARLKYGFSEREMDAYFAGRLEVYRNAALADPLTRLVRDPLRKLSRGERIIGAAALCRDYGISTDAFAPLLYSAVNFFDFRDEQSIRLSILKERKGVEGVLKEVCGLDPADGLYESLLSGYIAQSYRRA